MSIKTEYLPHFLRPTLSVPLNSEDDDAQVSVFETAQGRILPVFSSALGLARFCGDGQHYAEIPPSVVLSMAKEQGLSIGFDLEDAHGVILPTDAISQLADIIASQEAIENVESLDFIQSAWDPSSLEKFARVIPSNSDAWMMMSENFGAILIVESDGENLGEEAQMALREALFSWENGGTARLLVLPTNHPRLNKMRSDLQNFGQKLDRRPLKKDQKPPILRV